MHVLRIDAQDLRVGERFVGKDAGLRAGHRLRVGAVVAQQFGEHGARDQLAAGQHAGRGSDRRGPDRSGPPACRSRTDRAHGPSPSTRPPAETPRARVSSTREAAISRSSCGCERTAAELLDDGARVGGVRPVLRHEPIPFDRASRGSARRWLPRLCAADRRRPTSESARREPPSLRKRATCTRSLPSTSRGVTIPVAMKHDARRRFERVAEFRRRRYRARVSKKTASLCAVRTGTRTVVAAT